LPTLSGIGAEYLKGVDAERVVVLDLERVLADPRIVVNQEEA
jgi:purine-binding chemotaxis protein CheW